MRRINSVIIHRSFVASFLPFLLTTVAKTARFGLATWLFLPQENPKASTDTNY